MCFETSRLPRPLRSTSDPF